MKRKSIKTIPNFYYYRWIFASFGNILWNWESFFDENLLTQNEMSNKRDLVAFCSYDVKAEMIASNYLIKYNC